MTDAVIARLMTTTIPVGDARKPVGAGWQGPPGTSQFVTYFVVHDIGGLRDGPDAPISDRTAAPRGSFQVNSVGSTRRSAEVAADAAAAVLRNGADLAIAGFATTFVVHEFSAGVTADESTNPPVFLAVDRYRLDAEPLPPITSS